LQHDCGRHPPAATMCFLWSTFPSETEISDLYHGIIIYLDGVWCYVITHTHILESYNKNTKQNYKFIMYIEHMVTL
jgi:hypothetical protein